MGDRRIVHSSRRRGSSEKSSEDDDHPSPSKRARRMSAISKRPELHEPPPSLDKFLKMGSFRKLQIDEAVYEMNQDVYILPPEFNQEVQLIWPDKPKIWCGRIQKIRCPDPTRPQDTWVRVSWYYSPKDFTTLNVKDFDEAHCGSNELIHVPTHMDIIHGQTLNGPAQVTKFDEDDFDIDFTGKGLYYRGEFDHVKRKWIRGPPSDHCLCKVPFRLDKDSLMHFCPKAACNTWWHVKCLETNGYIEKNMTQQDIELYWEVSFDKDRLDFIEPSFYDDLEQSPQLTYDDVAYDSVPDELLALARRPINRGDTIYGVVGNAAVVLRARYLVCLIARLGEPLRDDWEEFVWLRDDPTADTDDSDTGDAPRRVHRPGFPKYQHKRAGQRIVCYSCPTCGDPI